MTHQEYINQVIKMRLRLINMNRSKINNMVALKKIQKIKRQVDAYGKKWNPEQWKAFLKRNYDDIVFLIPSNKSIFSSIETLNSLLL